MGRSKSDERISRSVGMLISMLVRYPEVGSVKFDPRQKTIRLSLLVSGPLEETEISQMQHRLVDMLEVYNLLDQRRTAIIEITHESFDNLTSFSITRDVATMSPPETWTIVEFFREWFKGRLVMEAADAAGDDEMLAQDEMIEELLANLDGAKPGHDVIAIRAEGRLMVFSK